MEAVLRSGKVNYWTGDRCRAFEQAWGAYHGGVHALAMANGSLALDVAVRALGIGPGDEVIVAARSYVASAMCVQLAGATPVFADVDPVSGVVTAQTLEAVRTARTKACIPVHVAGWPCDMPAIAAWAGQHGVHVIEDCAQGHGARIGGRLVGTWGVFACWSFCQDKIMTTGGEGGMLCTPDLRLWKKAWQMAQHGKDYDLAHTPAERPGFRWLVQQQGTNLRMTEMQAAIGLCQLHKLEDWLARRARNAGILQQALRAVRGLHVPATPDGHAHYRCMALATLPDQDTSARATTTSAAVDSASAVAPLAARRDRILAALADAGLPASVGSCPEIYREAFFAQQGIAPARPLPGAQALGAASLAFLVHHTIDEVTMHRHAAELGEVIRRADAGSAGATVPYGSA